VVSDDFLDPVVDQEETGVFRCGAYDGCGDALWYAGEVERLCLVAVGSR
jgi:hypothetical protein